MGAPQVVLAVFCDSFLDTGDYAKDFRGVVAKVVVPPGNELDIWTVVVLAAVAPGAHSLRRAFVLSDGTKVTEDAFRLHFERAGDTETCAARMTFTDFPAGIFWMIVYLDGREAVRSPLTVARRSAGVKRRSFDGTPHSPERES